MTAEIIRLRPDTNLTDGPVADFAAEFGMEFYPILECPAHGQVPHVDTGFNGFECCVCVSGTDPHDRIDRIHADHLRGEA